MMKATKQYQYAVLHLLVMQAWPPYQTNLVVENEGRINQSENYQTSRTCKEMRIAANTQSPQ